MAKRISKEEMDSLTKEIDKKLYDFIKEGKYKDVLVSMGNLGKYSVNNQLYILIQKPEARTLNGLRKWNSYGRNVKKGEKGIRIFKPIICKKKENDGKEKKCVKGFQTGYVFDVSQTEGKEIDVFRFDESKIVESKEKILGSLKETAKENGYKFEYVSKEEMEEDCYGLCNHSTKEIKILKGLSDLQEISTSVHELGHALAHSQYREDFAGLTLKEKREIKEVEAESIACIVCSYLGLDTQNFNFSYIVGWSNGDVSKFRNNLDRISKYANTIIDHLNEINGENTRQINSS